MPRTILVGFDDSEPARNALRRALQEAAPGDHLVVLAVFEVPFDLVSPRGGGVWGESPEVAAGLPEPPQVAAVHAHAQEIIGDAPVEVSYDWATGNAGPTIVDVATARGASLIVVGSSPHGTWSQFFGGDTADDVLRYADGDVIVVK